jgi:thiol-disulfide isomerase/thioredoxin
MSIVLGLIVLTAGCLTGDNGDGDGNGDDPPHVGTTEGFTIPGFDFTDDQGVVRSMTSWGGDFTVVHIIDSDEEVYGPQFAQVRAIMGHFDNISVRALTLVSNGSVPGGSMEALADEYDITWAYGVPLTDLEEELSLVRPLTVFLLDADHIILLRADDILGQGRMVQAIEATWGIEPPADAFPEVGSAVPDLVWRDIDGVEGSLAALEGSPVLLNVWEMECPFCLQLFVELEKVSANHSSQGLQMVSIDLITWETEAQIRGVREQYNATWTFAIDGDNVQSRYDIWRLPTLVLLDGGGVVQWTWLGFTHSSIISGEVEKLI